MQIAPDRDAPNRDEVEPVIPSEALPRRGQGLFLLGSVIKALEGEKILLASGIDVRLIVPPLDLRTGCDLALSVADYEMLAAEQILLQAGLSIAGRRNSLDGTAELSQVVTREWFPGDDGAPKSYVMVRAGNMKITVRVCDGLIVNTSGGGCPDIPYLNLMLVGKRLDEAVRPRDLGKTLCGLMLDRAFGEAQAIVQSTRDDMLQALEKEQ